MSYIKQAFDVTTFEQAKHVVLSNSDVNKDKFIQETQFLIDIIKKLDIIKENDTVLDFGCGMGRVSRELVHQFNANVIGVDISDSMLTFAKLYVGNLNKFQTYNTYDIPDSIDVVIATFVLQHVENPDQELRKINSMLHNGGYLVILNENFRLIPADVDNEGYIVWNDDSYDVFEEASKCFDLIETIPYINDELAVRVYRKKAS